MSLQGYRSECEPPPAALDHANWEVPWRAKVPAIGLAACMGLLWAYHIPLGGMLEWGLSAFALKQGRWFALLSHMFAHAGLWHILMNGLVLVPLGGLVTARLGTLVESWLRFLALFFLSGLAGGALYLAIHPNGSVPMVGASGAICGIVGLLLRLQDDGYELHPLKSARMRLAAKEFFKENVTLILILTVPAILMGQPGGVAWEAHLGGLLFGLLIGPKLLPRPPLGAGQEVSIAQEESR